jgi:hypothetical protein
MGKYDDERYNVITRTWFGLSVTKGGQGGAYTFSSATTLSHVIQWRPRGDIDILKVGYAVMATSVHAATVSAARTTRFLTRGASASVVALVIPATSTQNQWTIGSTSTLTTSVCRAGEYLTVKTATPRTIRATAAGGWGTVKQSTVSGSYAFFVDWKPKYGSTWR